MGRRLQSIFRDLVQVCLLLPILLVATSRGCKLQECIDAYNTSNICESITEAEQCIIDNGCEDVISSKKIDFEIQLNQDKENNNCTTLPPPCINQLPVFNSNLSIMDLGNPVINYSNSDFLCFRNLSTDKRHCSMFTYSHIRQFSHNTIQTCFVEGLQPLINHDKLSIMVTGVTDNQSPRCTNLEEIKVYVYPDECTGNEMLSYTAYATEALPLSMKNHVPGVTSAEVNINSDRTVVSILLPWMDTTLVIHRYAQHLGIVIHMPVEMAESDSGLCGEGCSLDSQIDPAAYIENYCPSNQESSMLGCKSKSGLLSDFQDSQLRDQYLTVCQIDVLNSRSYNVISVTSAVVTTSKLLPNNDEISVNFFSGSGDGGIQPLDCTDLSSSSPDVETLPEPVMNLNLNKLNGQCGPHAPKAGALRQCGMFTYSHLRRFNSYPIQTPSLPGKWVLVKYDDLLIEVVADTKSSGFSKLEEISITLNLAGDSQCTYGLTLSYFASASSSLPEKITYSDPAFAAFVTLVQVDSDGDIASIHIPWLNTTLVIRRNAGFLSIVVQMPAEFVPSVEGLCNGGYPNYSSDKFDNFISEQESLCPDDTIGDVIVNCFFQTFILNQVDGGPELLTTFADICQFDILKTLSYDGLSMIRAVARDLLLLWDVGIYIYPSTEPPTDPPDSSLSPIPSSSQIHSTTISISTEMATPTAAISPLSETPGVSETGIPIVVFPPLLATPIPSSSQTHCHMLYLLLLLVALSLALVIHLL